ncbi:MAG: sulfatase, partial [Methylobacterium sp.]|nr:sulfatase [Methylobacterium sp.]
MRRARCRGRNPASSPRFLHQSPVDWNLRMSRLKTLSPSRAVLFGYFVLVYVWLLVLNAGNIDFALAHQSGAFSLVFILNALLSYNALYLLPAIVLSWLAGSSRVWRWLGLAHHAPRAAESMAIAGGSLTTLFFYASAKLHMLYGMYVNGFVVNLVVTPGGLESLGGSDASNVGFALIAMGFLVGNMVLLFAVKLLLQRHHKFQHLRRSSLAVLLLVLLASTVFDRMTYAYHAATGRNQLLTLTQGIPYYVATSARGVFKRLGIKVVAAEKGIKIQGSLNYPARPIAFSKPARPYNIVWLVSESWRADTLNEAIMPATWTFAQQAQNFRLHYSGGNGTRIGIFTMLTGIPGTYWASFLENRQGSPFIELLQKQDYQMSFYTSAKFSYPEFDKTVFSQVPASQLHEAGSGQGWQRDRQNVSEMLDFLGKRDPGRPFFTWMFFESPHARYY